jgi:hypothetical protein
MAVSTTVINTVARRLRDTSNFAYPRAELIRFVDHAQRVINAHLKAVLLTVDITEAAVSGLGKFTSVYRINTLLALAGGQAASSIEAVRHNEKTLERVGWRNIVHQDRNWFQESGKRWLLWATIGKDLLILYPHFLSNRTDSVLEVVYTPAVPSTILDNGTNDIVLPDDLIPVLQDFVEVLALLSGRRFSEASDPISRLQLELDSLRRQYQVQDVAGGV